MLSAGWRCVAVGAGRWSAGQPLQSPVIAIVDGTNVACRDGGWGRGEVGLRRVGVTSFCANGVLLECSAFDCLGKLYDIREQALQPGILRVRPVLPPNVLLRIVCGFIGVLALQNDSRRYFVLPNTPLRAE